MIAPESGTGSNRQTSLGVLLRNNLAVSALFFALLEAWRPCFFLTDDNLDGGYPVFMEIGTRLLHGQSPFISDYLFGGNYFLLRDATYFSWHPVYLVASLLAGTPFHFMILDVDAFVCFMLATAGFVNLAWYLRREMSLTLSDGWIMFYSLSFTYSVIVLAVGASWSEFLANQSAMPWLALGILQKNWRSGIGLVALFVWHQIMGGHPLPTISNTIFFSLFALGISLTCRSVLPIGCWAIGYALALLIVLPLFLPMVEGFLSTARAQGVPLADMQENNIPPLLFPTSLFIGMALWIIHPPIHPHVTYTLAFGSCAAAWCFIPALASRARWRGLDAVCLGMVIFGIVMVCRPMWITRIMSHLPILKSMRWPFREMLQFQFFLHLFLLVRPPGFAPRVRLRMALFSSGLVVIPLFLYILPPTLNDMTMDRELLFAHEADRYWDRVRLLLKPTDRIAVLMSYDTYVQDRYPIPNSLLASYNYSILARVVNVSGYSHTTPNDQLYVKTVPEFPNGVFGTGQKVALLKERPDLKFITLENVHPLKITLSSCDGPTIDLTPYIPPQIRTP